MSWAIPGIGMNMNTRTHPRPSFFETNAGPEYLVPSGFLWVNDQGVPGMPVAGAFGLLGPFFTSYPIKTNAES